ncbi:MAG: ABC transporter permease [Firmicutes bacterium]|nr:ABC transporter permease [Bacillota bacterium]
MIKFLYSLYLALKMALKSIAGNKMRAFLTMLGIIIGVFSLVVLVSLVNGTTSTVTDTISDLGKDMLTVRISDDKGKPIRLDDLAQWSDEAGIGHIATSGTSTVTAKYGSNSDSMTVTGTTPSYYSIQGLNLLLGRFLKTADVESHTYVCVINETTATELIGYTDCLGAEISLNGTKFTVVGVLEDSDNTLTNLLTAGSLVAYVPYTSLVRLSTTVTSNITSFYVSAETTIEAAETAITDLLMNRFQNDEDAFSVSSTQFLEDAMNDVTSILSILLGSIAAISLIVGGIGIMNIMLVTVTERTREIGIRKAIGATRGEILRQFLIEAVVLCMMGCAIGIGLSWVTLQTVSVVVSSLSMTFQLEGNVVILSVVFCFFIGLVFGLYPANKAAKMQPIDALHYGG